MLDFRKVSMETLSFSFLYFLVRDGKCFGDNRFIEDLPLEETLWGGGL